MKLFLNKYCNFPFQVFSIPFFFLWYFSRHPDIKKQTLGYKWAWETKNWLIIILKGLITQPVKKSPTIVSFSFLIYCCISVFFSFLIKAFANFEKLIWFHWQAFIVYKTGENVKVRIEIFCQKLIVSNVVSAFLDWNVIFSSSANNGGRHRAPILFKISRSASAHCLWSCIYLFIWVKYWFYIKRFFFNSFY